MNHQVKNTYGEAEV